VYFSVAKLAHFALNCYPVLDWCTTSLWPSTQNDQWFT